MIKESIFSFLKIRKVLIIIFAGIVVIFGILFYLYDIPFMRLSMDANCLLCGVQYVCLLIFTNIINGISYYISTGSSFLTMQNNSQSIWILLNMIIRNLQRNYIRQSRSLFLRIELQKKSCWHLSMLTACIPYNDVHLDNCLLSQ